MLLDVLNKLSKSDFRTVEVDLSFSVILPEDVANELAQTVGSELPWDEISGSYYLPLLGVLDVYCKTKPQGDLAPCRVVFNCELDVERNLHKCRYLSSILDRLDRDFALLKKLYIFPKNVQQAVKIAEIVGGPVYPEHHGETKWLSSCDGTVNIFLRGE